MPIAIGDDASGGEWEIRKGEKLWRLGWSYNSHISSLHKSIITWSWNHNDTVSSSVYCRCKRQIQKVMKGSRLVDYKQASTHSLHLYTSFFKYGSSECVFGLTTLRWGTMNVNTELILQCTTHTVFGSKFLAAERKTEPILWGYFWGILTLTALNVALRLPWMMCISCFLCLKVPMLKNSN